MKQLTQTLFFLCAMALLLPACKKDENKVFFEGGTAPELKASTNTLNLSFANAANVAVKLSWSNPNYRMSTGVSSHDVNYRVEIDKSGANFSSPNKQTVAISNGLDVTFTVGQFNDYLLNQLELEFGVQRAVDIRVVSTIGATGAVPLYSNTLTYTVTPYEIPPKVVPPASGELFITGSGTPASWMAGGDAPLASQKFVKKSNTLYELPSIALSADNSVLFVPIYGNWTFKYGYTEGGNTNNVNGDDFKVDGSDIKVPAASGNYKVVVDFQRGKFTITKL